MANPTTNFGFGNPSFTTAPSSWGPTLNGTIDAIDDALVYDVPAGLAISAPPKIRDRDHRRSVLNFADVPAPADYRNTFQNALQSGEKLWLPRGDYLINSKTSVYGVLIQQSGLPIDIECHKQAKIIAGPVFDNLGSCYLFSLQSYNSGESPQNRNPSEPFRWSGGILDYSARTAANPAAGSGHSCVLMDVKGWLKPEITGVFFNGGVRSPFAGVGEGRLDTCLAIHYSIDPVVTNCLFQGAYDLAVYENGLGRIMAATNAATVDGSSVVRIAFANNHLLQVGDRIFPSGALVGGVNFSREMTVTSIVSTNIVDATAGQTATSTASSNVSFNVTDMNSARLGWKRPGEGSLYAFNHFSNCHNTISLKRWKKGTRIIGNHFRDCGAGIKTSDTGDHDFGAHLLVMGNTFTRMGGRTLAAYGSPGVRFIGNEIQDFGKTLGDDGGSYFADKIAAVELISSPGAVIQGNSIRQTRKFREGVPPADDDSVAFRLLGGEGFIDASNNCDITGNIVDGVYRYLDETSICSGNTFDNTVIGSRAPSIFRGTNTTLTVRGATSFVPEITFSGGGSVTAYDTRGGSYSVVNSIVELEAYLDVQSFSDIPAPSGYVRVVLPFTNTTGRPIHASSCVGQFSPIGAGWQLVGRIPVGSNEMIIYKISNGSLHMITPAELGVNARLQFDIRIPLHKIGALAI